MPAAVPEGHPRASQSAPNPAKEPLRVRLRAARAARPATPDADAARTLRCLDACAGHAVVACYASTGDEPDTWTLIDALAARGVRVLLPLLAGRRTPAWARYDGPDALRAGWQGILEPTGPSLGPEGLAGATFVWASALAATPQGDRLGTGGAWYDRALAWADADATVGVLVDDADVLDALPLDPWDRPVDVVVTPTRTLWAHRRGIVAHARAL